MTALQNRRRSKGRHPLLKQGSIPHRIYTELKLRPGQTYQQLAEQILEKPQSVNAQLQRMKAEGLIVVVPAQKGNRIISTYRVVDENVTGHARDKVQIRVTVFVNDYGEYSCESIVVGQLATAKEDNPKPVEVHHFYMAVPKPDEPYSTRQIFSEGYGGGSASKNMTIIDLEANKPDI